MMKTFRFAILGAGGVAQKFCRAVALTDGCSVVAVASKSRERAMRFAAQNGLSEYYDSYEVMLVTERPDCAYIAVTPNDHYRLTALCIGYGIPVICEKAMFQNSREAQDAFRMASEHGVFVMEAMWSRFLPAVNCVKRWLEEGQIGAPEAAQFSIGFLAPVDRNNRYYNPALGGGAAKDITVYAYELSTYILGQEVRDIAVTASWSDTGVDISDHVMLRFERALVELLASFAAKMEERMVIYGRKGKIVLPSPHISSECFLYGENGELLEHFQDKETENGFVYEIREAVRCVEEGLLESKVIPWRDTLNCARLFDLIEETRDGGIVTANAKRQDGSGQEM